MKLIYVFVFVLGVCSGEDESHKDSKNVPKFAPPFGPFPYDDDVKTRDMPSQNTVSTKPSVDPKITTNTESVSKNESLPTHSTLKPDQTTSTMPTTVTTSTALPITTTKAPPSPSFGIGTWNVTNNEGKVCMLLKGKIELNLFETINNTLIHNFQVPTNVEYHGDCSKECIEFDLLNNSTLHLMFEKNKTTNMFYLHAIKANLTYELHNKTATGDFVNNSLHLFENHCDQSYYCEPPSENEMGRKPMLKLTLKVSDFQVQAFMNSSKPNFDTAVNCEAPATPDLVPIVVGCALGLLVILVLVAYLISRRRSQSRGYVSM